MQNKEILVHFIDKEGVLTAAAVSEMDPMKVMVKSGTEYFQFRTDSSVSMKEVGRFYLGGTVYSGYDIRTSESIPFNEKNIMSVCLDKHRCDAVYLSPSGEYFPFYFMRDVVLQTWLKE